MALGATGSAHVRGLAELQRAFKAAGGDLPKEIRDELKRAAIPVQQSAERLAVGEISHIGPKWSRMRIGVTTGAVYLAPQQRRKAGHDARWGRPNLAIRLLDKAMQPALDENADEIVRRLEQVLDNLADFHGF